MTNPCIFCGATSKKLTNEHVISAWIGAKFRRGGPITHQGFLRDGTLAHRWETEGLSLTVRVTCEDCNNGWIHDLDIKVRPYLVPLIRGRGRSLLRRNYEGPLVAAWITKTEMLYEFAARSAEPPYFTQEERNLFRRSKQPPSGVSIFLTAVDSTHFSLHGASRIDLATPDGTYDAYIAVLSLGRLLSQLTAHRDDSQPPMDRAQRGIIRIWPSEDNVYWSPSPSVSQDNLEDLARYQGEKPSPTNPAPKDASP